MLKDNKLERVPREPVRWPRLPEVTTQIHQIQGSSLVPNGTNNVTTQGSQNQPQPVSIIGINSRLSGTSKIVAISFSTKATDSFFQKVNVLLQSGNALPVNIGSGVKSPIVIKIPRTRLPSVILLQAEGNWGPHPIQNSPSRAVNLL